MKSVWGIERVWKIERTRARESERTEGARGVHAAPGEGPLREDADDDGEADGLQQS